MRKPIFTQSLPSEGINTIKAETLFGNITLVGHQREDITVSVTSGMRDLAKWVDTDYESFERNPVNIIVENQVLTIKTVLSNKLLDWFRNIGVSIKIGIPLSIFYEIHLETQAGNCTLEQVKGKFFVRTKAGNLEFFEVNSEIKAKTGAGNIEFKNCNARMDISTGVGNVEFEKSEGDITISTTTGNIEAKDLVGNIYASTGVGNIKMKRVSGLLKLSATAGNIEVKSMNGSLGIATGSGNIDAEMFSINEFVNLESKYGNIEIQLPNTEGVNLDIEAKRIRPRYFDNFEGEHTKTWVNGTLNGGGASVTLKSNRGNVKIHSLKRARLESLNRTFENFNFNLPNNFFVRTAQGILLSLSICILLIYGFNSILYFTFGIFNPNDPLSTLYKGLLISNVCNGISVLVCTYIFIQYYEHKWTQNWIKYSVLICITLIGSLCTDMVLGILFWQKVRASLPPDDPSSSNVNLSYTLIPIVVACIYFYFWQRSQKITRKISEQEYQLLNLDKLKTKAELDALQARINPHFLYNALNSIAGLVHNDPDKAEQMTLLLSKLFRYTTGTKDQHFNTIEDELEIVKTYLEIEQVRFGDRLKYAVFVEEGIKNALIPRFLLQPIVENAIKHGISKLAEDGVIQVKIKKLDDRIILNVHDNGAPFPDNFFIGYGIQSIQDKLKLLYGDKAKFDIQNKEYKQISIEIPC